MAIAYPTAPCTDSQPEPDNIDLIRRYAPGLIEYPHANLAAHLHPDMGGCWPWDEYIDPQGYGAASLELTSYGYPERVKVHRHMYETLVGPVPPGHHVHHRCEYKACWHPLHIEAVTPKEHSARHRKQKPPQPPRQYSCDSRGQYLLFA